VLLNSVTLLLGSAISYMLARKTLRPIEEAMAAQDRFIADASHELRTPLTGLLLDNEVTLRKKSLTAKDVRMAMERNVQGLTKLKDLSDTLLDLVARQQKNAPRTVVSVEQIVRSAVSQVAPMANKKHITFVQNIANNTLTIDEAKLTKLLVILYDNAIKYSKPHTTVTLSSESVGSDILLTVHDQGIGMSHEEKEHIFDRLYRADASRSHGDGYGLGLAIARKLAHDLNGSIAVQSEPGHGSTFTVRLPRS
ncbi:MAG TPA: HAMP domain-containing sensor histidine kinase, partial [Candidatus Saccharimonadales bacterium]